jgi:orotidine-5'-phosphate decarboxylase
MFEGFTGNIIWSADVTLDELQEAIYGDFPKGSVAIKLDRLFLTKYGLGVIGEVQARGIPVFADAKITEIPSKCQEIAKLHLESNPWMLNIMADSLNTCLIPNDSGVLPDHDDDKIEELYLFANLCRQYGTKSCLVSVFTSKSKGAIEAQYGKSFEDVIAWYAKMARDCGFTDIVCSAKEAPIYRSIAGKSVQLNTPGIRLPDSSNDDQARVLTPADALANGANRLVIGRDLSRGGDFHGNLTKIMANIKGGN